MQCPKCKNDDTSVVDSRPTGETNRRRRQCVACGYRFTTREVMDDDLQELKNIRSCLAFLAKQAERSDPDEQTDQS